VKIDARYNLSAALKIGTLLSGALIIAGCTTPTGSSETPPLAMTDLPTISQLVRDAAKPANLRAGVAAGVKSAVLNDPQVQSAKKAVFLGDANLAEVKSALGPQLSGTLYSGIADAAEGEFGAAAVLSASRLLYDGGVTENQTRSAETARAAAFESYRVALNESAFAAVQAWADLHQYQSLEKIIEDRLSILDPLIAQLEQVANAGIADATVVANAQRTVTMIRVTQSEVSEQHLRAQEQFARIFGHLPKTTGFDATVIAKAAAKTNPSNSKLLSAPRLAAAYLDFVRADSDVKALEAQSNFKVGLEASFVEPMGDSTQSKDARVGFVIRKTFSDGGRLEAQIEQAKLTKDQKVNAVEASHRSLLGAVQDARQSIRAMERSAELSRKNAEYARNEIEFLRKQLVIGQSSLDKVLSAEARLYEAEASLVKIAATKVTAQATLLAALGDLAPTIGLSAAHLIME
jgi:outer membrane protein TolC